MDYQAANVSESFDYVLGLMFFILLSLYCLFYLYKERSYQSGPMQ
ncbi:hypothetical protein F888_03634 [Acinetobacter courvalinii]|uniref:Uncharacterized protein n=1 Tax=Acinetobacter courvalinii TaxID=280147 RepID=N9R0D8_9GAMM|nr:hypothetical protein F888_03634 [Acinetobacter courvalinii]